MITAMPILARCWYCESQNPRQDYFCPRCCARLVALPGLRKRYVPVEDLPEDARLARNRKQLDYYYARKAKEAIKKASVSIST
jgi:hypothetical protein